MDIKINNYQTSALMNPDKLNIENPAENENTAVKSAVRTDNITISPEGKQFADNEKIKKANEYLAKHDELWAEQTANAMEHITDGMETALEIYRRIAGGAKVSPEDEQFLMLYSRPMYMAAKNAQEMKEKKEDMSDESLIKEFEERHANDRRDWTTELNDMTDEINTTGITEPANAECELNENK